MSIEKPLKRGFIYYLLFIIFIFIKVFDILSTITFNYRLSFYIIKYRITTFGCFRIITARCCFFRFSFRLGKLRRHHIRNHSSTCRCPGQSVGQLVVACIRVWPFR